MIGRVLGKRYEIISELGGGGMSVVYKGRDRLLNRIVTIKVLRDQFASDEDFVRRFRREAQAVASLSHPNIVSIYDVGEEDHLHYLVMEYVEGTTLKEVIKKRAPLPPGEASNIAIQILEGLEHAHENGVIHRDIKPHNILITPAGRVKVTDFGLARAAANATVTYTGSMVGSVHYLSPEQARGELTNARSDIYATGVVIYEMLTGRVPFAGDGPIAVAMQHLETPPPSPRELVPGLAPALERIVLKAMAKRPADRYATAREMRQALERVRWSAEEDTGALPDPEGLEEEITEMAARRKKRRLKTGGWVLLVLLLAGLAYGGYLGLMRFLEVGQAAVPPVVGQPLAEAEALVRQAGFEPRPGEKRYTADFAAGVVMAQRPEARQVVPRGRQVFLDVSLGPRLRKVPNLIGDNERTARIKLENAGLKVGEDTRQVVNAQFAAGTVIEQEPKADIEVPEGAGVDLVISKGPAPQYIAMPNLVSKTLDEAAALLNTNGLSLGVVDRQPSDLYFSGQVMSQDVAADTPILQGTVVNLVVSNGPGPTVQQATISNIVVPDDRREHQVRVVVEDVRGSHEEYSRPHAAGERVSATVPFYGKGRILVYIDETMIYQEAVPRE